VSSYRHARDLVGYGADPPHPHWPHDARIAVSFVLNYEEGGENCVAAGDSIPETYIAEIAGLQAVPGTRILAAESLYDFGARVGVWRIARLFTERRIPLTVYAVGQAAEGNPGAIAALSHSGHEIASHHYRWFDYYGVAEDEERQHLQRATAAIERITGRRPVGFYGGRTSLNTRRLVAEDGGFLYESDAYSDELPYWEDVAGIPLLIIPYMLDNNDFKYSTLPNWGSAQAFFEYNKASFDLLYHEGARLPRMLSVGLHCRVSGRPGRAEALLRLLDYMQGHERVWFCTREQIARHWAARFPPPNVH
jgi:putative urate catabolism protein